MGVRLLGVRVWAAKCLDVSCKYLPKSDGQRCSNGHLQPDVPRHRVERGGPVVRRRFRVIEMGHHFRTHCVHDSPGHQTSHGKRTCEREKEGRHCSPVGIQYSHPNLTKTKYFFVVEFDLNFIIPFWIIFFEKTGKNIKQCNRSPPTGQFENKIQYWLVRMAHLTSPHVQCTLIISLFWKSLNAKFLIFFFPFNESFSSSPSSTDVTSHFRIGTTCSAYSPPPTITRKPTGNHQ